MLCIQHGRAMNLKEMETHTELRLSKVCLGKSQTMSVLINAENVASIAFILAFLLEA